jgi:hypothetical protein
MARTIINAKDVRKALKGEQVEPMKKQTKAAQARAKSVAQDICKALVFFAEVNPEAHYFKVIDNLNALKAKYKELAIQNHPDNGGDTATMAKINAEYDEKVKELAKKTKVNAKTKVAEKTEGMTDEEISAAIAAEFKATMDALAKMELDGVQIELIGSWLWVSGNTKPIKDNLKAAGFRWCPKKEGKPWTWHDSYTYYPSAKGRMTKEDIEDKHGKEVLKSA